jgi:hypothetical protein
MQKFKVWMFLTVAIGCNHSEASAKGEDELFLDAPTVDSKAICSALHHGSDAKIGGL